MIVRAWYGYDGQEHEDGMSDGMVLMNLIVIKMTKKTRLPLRTNGL
jgi:hypothetical protein